MADDEIEKVVTGAVWLGTQALELGLVGEIKTFDEFLLEKVLNRDKVLFKLRKYDKKKMSFGFSSATLQQYKPIIGHGL